jgi:large subunit ribosomal protein L10
MTMHTRKWKETQVQELQHLADKYPVIAVASIKNFPGALAKELRKKLQNKAVVKVSKTRVIEKALKQSKLDTKELLQHAKGSVAIIFSEMNAFELYAFLKRNKVSMPAKAGLVAPDDIIVPAGDTGLPPGPVLSDLKAAGLKTVMQGPTISIAEDKLVTKKGETISSQVASALSKLAIKPVKVGLNLVACLEKSQLFLANILDIDAEKVKQQFANAHRNAFNLAIEVGYFTKDTLNFMVSKAFRQAKAVALEANLVNSATIAPILAKANAQAAALKAKIPEKQAEAKPAEKKPEQKPKEETKEEKPEGKGKEKPAELPKKEKPEGKAEEKPREKPEERKPEAKKAGKEKKK